MQGVAVILAGACGFFEGQRQLLQTQAEDSLTAIAKLKARQTAD